MVLVYSYNLYVRKILSDLFFKALKSLIMLALGVSFVQAEAKSVKKITIAGLTWVGMEAFKAVIPIYEKQSGVKVELVQFPYSDLYVKLLTAFETESTDYDIAFMDDPWMPKFAGDRHLLALDQYFNYAPPEDFIQKTIDVGLWPPPYGPIHPRDKNRKRHLYGLPVVGNVSMHAYNTKIFEEYGIPDAAERQLTLEEVLEISKKVYDPNKPVYGYVIRGKRGNPICCNWIPILRGFGGDIFDDNWNVIVNNDKGVAALEYLLQLKNYAPPGVENYDADEVTTSLCTRPFSAQGPNWPGQLEVVDNPKLSQIPGVIGATLWPALPGVESAPLQGNWLFGIPKYVDDAHKRAAFDFMKWFTSKEVQVLYVASGGVPFRKSTFEAPTLLSDWRNRHFPVQRKSLEKARWRPRTTEWTKVEDVLGLYLNEALAGKKTPKEALDLAAKKIHDIMDRAGYYR